MLLVDAHVHLYPAVDVARLLDAAAANFARVATAQGAVAPLGVLMLTESGVLDRYAELQSRGAHQLGAWSLRPVAGEDLALLASNGDSRILVVAGRQVVTAEGLEVLQLATRAHARDGLPLDEVLRVGEQADAINVLPWGAGKWLGARGRLVAACAGRVREGSLLLGDNGGRPALWPEPAPLRAARRAGRIVLSGSDPLPIEGDERRVGSFGVAFTDAALDERAPVAALKRLVRGAGAASARPFGASLGLGAFVAAQRALRRVPRAAWSGKVADKDAPADIETSSADYARRFAGKAGRYLLDVQAMAVREALRGLKPGRALDVGGGHGQLVPVLRELGWNVTVHGSDPECERNLRELHGQRDVEFLLSDMFAVPRPDASFDLVLAVRLVSHCDDWPRLLAEMCRLSRQAVLIDYPCQSGLNALTPWLFSLKKSLEGNTRTYTSFSRAQLAQQFAASGFDRLTEVKQFLLPMVVHRRTHAAAPFRAFESVARSVGLTGRFGSPAILRADRTDVGGRT